MAFSDLSISMQMRDTIEKLVRQTVDKVRPPYRYGVVQAMDWTASKATVLLTGDTAPVIVPYGLAAPSVGSTVRVAGQGTDRYIEDVIGSGMRGIPTGANLNSYTKTGEFLLDSASVANTVLNLPVPPIPAVPLNYARNPLALPQWPVAAITNNATYWTVSRGSGITPGNESPYGTTQCDLVTPIGSPRGNGLLASVYNVDGLDASFAAARTVSLHIRPFAPSSVVQYRVQGGGSWITIPNEAWSRISWSVPASTNAILEVRRSDGFVGSGWSVQLTDYEAIPYTAGTLRSASIGTLRVTATANRVIQRFTCMFTMANTGKKIVTYERLRGSDALWGRWSMIEDAIPAFSNSEVDTLLASQVSASIFSPVTVKRNDFWPPIQQETLNGNTLWNPATRTMWTAPGWVGVSFNTNWTNYGSGYANVQAFRTVEGLVILRGLAKYVPAGNPAGQVIATLPVGFRPSGKLMLGNSDSANTAGGTFQIAPTGEITWFGNASGNASYVNLECVFPCAEVAPDGAWKPVTMSVVATSGSGGVNWIDYHTLDSSFPPIGYWVDPEGKVFFRGMARASAAWAGDGLAFSFPAEYVPSLILHVNGAGSTGYSSQHIRSVAAGTGLYVRAGSPTSWNSFSNAVLLPDAKFPDSRWTALPLAGGWVTYGAPNPDPAWIITDDGIMWFRGLIKNGTGTPMATLGVNNRQQASGGTQISTMAANNGANTASRVDVATTGTIGPVPSPGATGWRSLATVRYLIEG